MQTVYRIQHTNFEGVNIVVDIIDTLTSGTPTYTELVGAGFSRVTPTDDDVFKPIRGIEATIKFYSTDTIGAHTFKGGELNRWKVQAFTDTFTYIFVGYLATDDLREPYFDAPNEVTLTATDGLGSLKDVAMVDLDDINPKGYYTLAQYIAFCLRPTALTLNITICCGVTEINQSNHIFDTGFLQSKTFEENIGVSENCYSALEKILKAFGCFLQQRENTWWIMAVDEFQPGANDFYLYDAEGTYSVTNPASYTQTIGTGGPIVFINEDQIAGFRNYNNFVQLDYNYEYPAEIVDNIDFSRGDFNGVISMPADHSAFDVEDWTMGRWNSSDPETPTSTTTTAYIERVFEDGYEKERFLVLKVSNGETMPPFTAIRSNAIPVGTKDRVTVSVDLAFKNATGSNGPGILGLILKGSNGTVYIGTQNGWTTIYGTAFFEPYHYPAGSDHRVWSTLSVEYPPFPIGGELYIFLAAVRSNTNSLTDELYYQNLNVDYEPFINGSYRKYNGQYNKEYLNLNARPNFTDEVQITDSPKPLFKGDLFVDDTGEKVLAGTFYNIWRTPTPAAEDYYKFGKLQTITYWNQYGRVMVTIEGTAQGLWTVPAGTIPDCTWKFQLTDAHLNATGKTFMCVGFDQDFYSCEWSLTLVEVYDEAIGKEFDADFLFKYID